MNKKVGLIMIALVAIIGLAGCGNKKTVSTTNIEPKTTEINLEDNSIAKPTGEDTKNLYSIESGTLASYTVTKKWLNKPTEDVIGTASSIFGTIKYFPENNSLENINISIDGQTFNSGSEKRDAYVNGLLGEKIIISSTGTTKVQMGTFSETIPLNVTVNGVSKVVDFKIQGNATESYIEADGTGIAAFTDFDINPPGILNTYTVDDSITFNFILKASAQ